MVVVKGELVLRLGSEANLEAYLDAICNVNMARELPRPLNSVLPLDPQLLAVNETSPEVPAPSRLAIWKELMASAVTRRITRQLPLLLTLTN